MLDVQETAHTNGEKHLSAFDMMNLLKPLKNDGEHEWLYEISATSCQIVCQDLQKAYEGFFAKRTGFPKFKSKKKSKPNYPVCAEKLWFDEKGFAHIQKIGKVKFKTDFTLPIGTGNKFTNPRISYVLGKWLLSFGMECETQAHELTDKKMGIDVGIKDTMIVAYGDEKIVFPNINKSKRVRILKRKIKFLQRSISRKYGNNRIGNKYVKTRNIEKQEDLLRKLYAKLANIRMNYIHQSTHKLVSLLPYIITMEDLNVNGMMKNHHLAQSIQEQEFGEIIRQMKYKCEWYGIEFIQVDRFYPSSKTCHCCGNIKQDLKLKDRTYVCAECGYIEDRDFNAALNLRDAIA